MKLKATALKGVIITCMNPNKTAYAGDIYSTGNLTTGTIRRYVPFGVETHVEAMILGILREKMCQVFVERRGKNGQRTKEGKQIAEFSISELPPLTEAELKDLAQRQAMAAGTAES